MSGTGQAAPPAPQSSEATASSAASAGGPLALAMGGGGARAAYQVGFLRALARQFPGLKIPILTGVSAGAINTAFLANHRGTLQQSVEFLAGLWENLHTEQVFNSGSFSLSAMGLRWALRLISGGGGFTPPVRGLVDTEPLRHFLRSNLEANEAGELLGIRENLKESLRAVSITTTNYGTGQSVTWVQGNDLETWRRPHRISVAATLTVDHVMASAALPIFFPAVQIHDQWHGDGGIRLTAPLSPALHLGAGRILAISTRYQRTQIEAASASTSGYPPPAQVLGVLMNAIFLDMFDYDAMSMDRLNKYLVQLPEDRRLGLRPIELMILRPSRDISKLAGEYELDLPRSFRFLMRGLGTRETKSPDSLSMVMFEPDYLRHLIRLGEEDAETARADLAAFIAGERLPSVNRTGFWRI
jgi:NTE family protein